MKRSIIASIFMLSVLIYPRFSSAAENPYVTGVHQYNARQYQLAAKTFATALQQQPRNVSACLYLANCYYQMGQTKAAAQYYRWIADNFPRSAEAGTANVALLRMDATSINTTASDTPAGQSGIVRAASSSSSGTPDSMFKVIKPLADHPSCTPAFINSVKAAMKQCPPNVVAFVARKGCKICLTPTLIDRNPELHNSRPRGYEDGHTYKNTPAMFELPDVVVCQYAMIGDDDNNWQQLDDSLGPLRHEFGHAVDAYLGYLSYTPEYRHIYRLDVGGMEPETKDALAYYVQAGTEEGGPSESFAEACSIIFGGANSKWRIERQALFKQKFPGVLNYVKTKLASIK